MAGTGSASAHPTPDLIHPFLHSAPPRSLFLPCAGTVRGYKTEIGILSFFHDVCLVCNTFHRFEPEC